MDRSATGSKKHYFVKANYAVAALDGDSKLEATAQMDKALRAK
jgi:hypothetical protein